MKNIAMPKRSGPPSEAEVAGFHADRDRETNAVKSLVSGALASLGAGKIWTEALAVAGPVAVDAAGGLVKALHPESPGGSQITKEELRALAKDAATKLEAAILSEFAHLVVDPDPVPTRRRGKAEAA